MKCASKAEKKSTLAMLAMSAFFLCFIVLIPLIFALPASAAEKFEGSGTADDPYLITSSYDLMRLAAEVNETGNAFNGQYFALTNDIDMSGINFTPIGVLGDELYFFGIFDGRGYAVRNISINIPDANNGFFGALGGTVVNLEINGGSINGACCGIISSHAAGPEARILNCKSTNVTVNAERAGGIADNFSGSIINCVSEGCILNGTDSFGGISSYEVRESYGNYYSLAGSSGNEIKVDGSEEFISGMSDIQAIVEKLNANCSDPEIFPAAGSNICNIWEMAGSGTPELSNISYAEKIFSEFSELPGSGTANDPYLVSSAEELIMFRNAVNSGHDFHGEYILQTADIDLSNELWTPIGQMNYGNYFFGTYDGAGYAIKNINTIDHGNNGFFGALGGTVVNLEISGGTINGDCCGIISSHAASSGAKILNCKTANVTINAVRAGGIADNFSGSIINCVSEGCILNGTDSFGGIVSYEVRNSLNNYYSFESVGKGSEVKAEDSRELPSDQEELKALAEQFYTVYRHYGAFSIFPVKDYGIFNVWEISNRGTLEISHTRQSDLFIAALEKLSGSGTIDDPYLISTTDELVIFRDAVNSGHDFLREYVRQTADIDLSGELWTPIGVYGSDNFFFGTYDGAGHTINNIHTINYGNIGFFGMFGGTVLNLGIESGTIEGDYCGAIASHAYSNYATIINCYNKADVIGTRAGGIVDNYSGSVFGCWSNCNLTGESEGGIASHSAYKINYCLTSADKINLEDETRREGYTLNSYSNVDFSNASEVAKRLLKDLPDVKTASGTILDLYPIVAEGSDLVFADEPISLGTYGTDSLSAVNITYAVIIAFLISSAVFASFFLLFFLKTDKAIRKDFCKNYLKRFLLVICPVFLFFYMFFIHSPIEFFLVNNSELNFVLGDFAWNFILIAFTGTLAVSALAALLKEKACEIAACAMFGLDLCMYIQLNFMNGSLALLDGTENAVATVKNYINLVIWAVLFLLPFILFFVLKEYRKTVVMFLCAALSVMQISSIAWSAVRSPESAFRRADSEYVLVGNDRYNVSANNNIIILSLDTYSNSYIDEFFETYPEVADVVKDFTYYNNADCHYNPTVFSTNYLVSGTEFDMSVPIDEWCETAWNNEKNNKFYSRMAEQGYICNYYGIALGSLSSKAKHDAMGKVANLKEIGYDVVINDNVMFGLFMRANMYRFAPGILKHICEFSASDYSSASIIQSKLTKDIDTSVSTVNAEFYKGLLSDRIKTDSSSNYYVIQHLAGVHSPYTTDENCNVVNKTTLLQTERGCWRYIEEYLNQLKDLGVYDNAAIIVTSDHGELWIRAETYDKVPNAQPIFFIKKPGETHDKYVETNAPISFTDLMPTVLYLAGGEYSDIGTTVFEHTENEHRERILYARMYDKDLPESPKRNTPTDASYNCFYKYVYTGDGKVLKEMMGNGPTEKIPWADSFY